MEYRVKSLEHSGLRGKIGEQVARSYIRSVLAPKLVKEELWDHVVLNNNCYKQRARFGNTKLFNFDCFREDFLSNGFFASMKLLSKYADAVGILERNHCTPDGMLLKLKDLKKTGKVKQSECLFSARLRMLGLKTDGDYFILPVVDGEIEIVEIKCGRSAKLLDKQKETYNELIAKGVPLRMVNVRIVSFDLNRFLVEEKLHDRLL
jgi:hypothetical protein